MILFKNSKQEFDVKAVIVLILGISVSFFIAFFIESSEFRTNIYGLIFVLFLLGFIYCIFSHITFSYFKIYYERNVKIIAFGCFTFLYLPQFFFNPGKLFFLSSNLLFSFIQFWVYYIMAYKFVKSIGLRPFSVTDNKFFFEFMELKYKGMKNDYLDNLGFNENKNYLILKNFLNDKSRFERTNIFSEELKIWFLEKRMILEFKTDKYELNPVERRMVNNLINKLFEKRS